MTAVNGAVQLRSQDCRVRRGTHKGPTDARFYCYACSCAGSSATERSWRRLRLDGIRTWRSEIWSLWGLGAVKAVWLGNICPPFEDPKQGTLFASERQVNPINRAGLAPQSKDFGLRVSSARYVQAQQIIHDALANFMNPSSKMRTRMPPAASNPKKRVRIILGSVLGSRAFYAIGSRPSNHARFPCP